MKNELYINRLVEEKISSYLKIFGAICLEGPKYCGKSWIGEYFSTSQIYLSDPDQKKFVSLNLDYALEGSKPRLIDEYQTVPGVWDKVRNYVDKNSTKGIFILTGSSTPDDSSKTHTGTGRIAKINVYTMTLTETGDSSKKVSLSAIIKNKFNFVIKPEKDIFWIIKLMIRGGFPANLSLNEKQSFIFYNNYVKNLIEEDVQKIDGVKKNIPKMNALVKSLSRNSATNILNTTLLNDVSQYDTEISKNTLPQYLESLERCNFFYRIKAFSPFNAHSKTTIRTTDKIILCDECLGLALLNLNKDNILKQLNNFGHHFESFVLKELLAYASCINAEIFFYKDNTYEVDAIMVLEDKSYIAFEIKLGSDEEESAIQSLKKFDKFMEGKNNKPLKLVALIGVGSVSRKVEDNLYVVSLEHFTL